MSGAKPKSVLVTGAARRIGRRLALDLAKDGWDVAVHCNASMAEAEEVAGYIREIGRRAVIVRGDLSDADVPDRLIAEASAALGGLTCLINNASLFEPDEVGTITKASWAEHIDTNLRAPIFLSQAFAQQLPDGEEGNIISIIDQRVWKLNPKFFSYTTSKSGLGWPSSRSRTKPPTTYTAERCSRACAATARSSANRAGGRAASRRAARFWRAGLGAMSAMVLSRSVRVTMPITAPVLGSTTGT